MSDFWTFVQIGFGHVLDINGYDHLLFLIALAVPYAFKDWKKILILVTIFTVGHSLSLFLSIFNIIIVKANIIEFLIPITILITAFYNIITAGKNTKQTTITFISFVTLFFGIIHGLAFSNHFKTILAGSNTDNLLPLLEFSLGIELAQIVVIFIVLLFSFIIQGFFKFNKRDFTLLLSAFVIGVVVPMIIENPIWQK